MTRLQVFSSFSGDPIAFRTYVSAFDAATHDGWVYYPINEAPHHIESATVAEALMVAREEGLHVFGLCEGSVFGEETDILYPIFTNEEEQSWSLLYKGETKAVGGGVGAGFEIERVGFKTVHEALSHVDPELREVYGTVYLLMNGDVVGKIK